ncbi:MAG: hypothetical protein JST43_05315 [Bacteroidetes bacterium]|nr:hypothetical protein [Bacteroidota bacterium]MBS1540965.1 hypothetical protein [Bacteroidota bacterium]
MKFWLQRIILPAFLLSTLLFAQLGVNFFHHNHDIHQLKSATAVPLKSGEAGVQTHDGEHCRVCAVDGFHHSFVAVAEIFFTPNLQATPFAYFHYSYFFACLSFSQGRAPPRCC